MTNINRTVEIMFAAPGTKGVIIAERVALVRKRERTIFTIRGADGTTFEIDSRRTSTPMQFMSSEEAISELYLNEAIDARLGNL